MLWSISDSTDRRIFPEHLQFHPYKLAVVQELTERDFVACQNACDILIDNLPKDAVIFFSDEAHAIFSWGYLNSLVYVDRPRTIAHLKNNIRDAIANIPIDILQ